MRAIVIDDEAHCVRTLNWELEQHCPEVEVVASCTSSPEGLGAIRQFEPDVVFLDIEMPQMNGFELLEKLSPFSFSVIFTTAYDEFAVRAFKVSATDYLLKPIDSSELKAAVGRVNDKHSTPSAEQLSIAQSAYQNHGSGFTRLALPSADGLEFVNAEDIIQCISESNYTKLVFENANPMLISRTLKDVENLLQGGPFFRVHKSHLINLQKVQTYHRGEGGHLVLQNGEKVPVARSRKEGFLQQFAKL